MVCFKAQVCVLTHQHGVAYIDAAVIHQILGLLGYKIAC